MKENNTPDETTINPLVSVVMPAYNAEKYIDQAISSVISQTYTKWELLIIDDCSTDGTAKIAECFASQDSRIRLLRNSQNMGVARSRNRGLDIAKGEWIALLDSDDAWREMKLEKQLTVAERTNADIVYCSYSMMDETSAHLFDYIVPETTSYDALLKENTIGCSTALIRRSALQQHRFSTEYYHEDYVLWLELLKSAHTAAASREILSDYRIVRDSRSNDKLKSAKNRWLIYRKTEKLPFLKSVLAFAAYAVNGIRKY